MLLAVLELQLILGSCLLQKNVVHMENMAYQAHLNFLCLANKKSVDVAKHTQHIPCFPLIP